MKNIKIGSRLSAAFGLVLFLLMGVSGYSLVRMSEIQDRLNEIVNVNDVKQNLVTTMFSAIGDQALSLRNLVLLSEPDAVKAEVVRLAQTRQQYDDAKQSLMQLLATSGDENASEQKLLATVLASEAAAGKIFAQIESLSVAHNNEQAIAIMFGDSRATLRSWRQSLSDLVKYESDKNLVAVEHVDRAYKNTRNTTIVIVAAAVLLSLLITRLMTRSITRPLNTAVGIAQQVAGGDLTAQIDPMSRDETGQMIQALKEMNASLSNIVGQVRTGAELIGAASSQIAIGNLDLSSRTEEQAGSLQQTAAAMEELTSTVRENSSHTHRASQLALSATEAAATGGALVGQVVGTMEDINVSSQKISGIVNVIDTIAFQTNMLALNASVEAARAGEQGRGFAVVAAEVRALAQHSAAAAKEIKALIGASAEKMNIASKLVTDTGLTMDDIIARIRNVADVVNEIAEAGEQQSAGIQQVNAAISQMDGTTQQNAALVEEAAAASQSLQEQAMALTHLVSVFKLGDMLLPAESHSHLMRAEPARLTASHGAADNNRARIGFN